MPVVSSQSKGSGDAPRQFNQPSRKGKKAWRKNVDVTDVQLGLEELNEEIIRGGVIREKDSSELFTIDLAGDSRISKQFPKHVKKGLKADEILAQRSAVPAVSLRKRPGEKTSNEDLSTKRLRTDWVPHKELQRLRRVADGHHGGTVEAKDATYDVWGDAPSTKTDNVLDFLPVPDSVKQPKSLSQRPISLAASGKSIAAVPKPGGGYSYNPLSTDYEARLSEESAKVLEAERRKVELEEVERQKQEAAARSAAEAEAAEERANMSEWEDDSEWEGFQSGVEDEKPNTKRPQRKTPAQRNRIKRRKEEERLAKHKAAMKIRRAQEQRIKEIAAEVLDREQTKSAITVEGSNAGIELGDDKLRRRQLGKFKLPEKDLELVLPDELEESLRLLKPEGNLLKDRYRSMLVRGRIESRRHIPFKKQGKRKVTEKWSHKDFVL
ncbi:60S ribosomal biogenesis protein Nop53 [Pochonia chlamydosporia 170]|uniref:Ribosome biogenesis protein NOP53 n=1 Tax=Pochonia chlamydosporia 170 TaxID=1380566 RepID=A0A179F9U4_METCM|nr:60S ribosomal biogenesis protein Nop53 [Pochonia chlamydosporia 170]OAQ62226.1 60S ribosomal biogenesis protein Nop53 [Pochonia chlamydosporia 170]